MNYRILTQHPQGKAGVNISKAKYIAVKNAIIASLERSGDLTFSELADRVEEELSEDFEGSIRWYFTTVKLDLEAKHVIERTHSKPQRLHLITK